MIITGKTSLSPEEHSLLLYLLGALQSSPHQKDTLISLSKRENCSKQYSNYIERLSNYSEKIRQEIRQELL